MKKMKLMLTAIGVLGIVGAALAFNVRGNQTVYCDDPATPDVIDCTDPIRPATLTPNPTFLFQSHCTLVQGGEPCPLVDVYQGE